MQFAALVVGQKQIDQSRGNECRHTCILSRTTLNLTRSTHWTETVQCVLRDKISLVETGVASPGIRFRPSQVPGKYKQKPLRVVPHTKEMHEFR